MIITLNNNCVNGIGKNKRLTIIIIHVHKNNRNDDHDHNIEYNEDIGANDNAGLDNNTSKK